MRRASRRLRLEMNMLWFTKGIIAAPRRHRRSPHWASESAVAPKGRLKLIPKAKVGFPAEVCESE